MAEQDSDRSEQATPHKLDEARKKGSVAKSMDLTSCAMLAGLVVALYALAGDGLEKLVRQQRHVLQLARADWSTPEQVAQWLGSLLVDSLSLLGPLFLILVVCAVLVNFAQAGPVFSTHPLVPDFNRLNPGEGLKRIFSFRSLFEAVKSSLKLVVLGAVLYFALCDLAVDLVRLLSLPPRSYGIQLVGLTAGLLVKLLLAYGALAAIDLLFTRWEFARRMRMSKRDIKDEVKNREGDPRIRSRLRALRQEMLERSKAVSKVSKADVVITNPTHLCVALSYDHGHSAAPLVVAKGAGDLAKRMREVAQRHRIPVVQNKPLARALFREVREDGFVPEKWYPQVAKIMVWVYAMRRQQYFL